MLTDPAILWKNTVWKNTIWKNTVQKTTFLKNAPWKIHFGKVHFGNIYILGKYTLEIQNLKAVGQNFQKIYHVPWSMDALCRSRSTDTVEI